MDVALVGLELPGVENHSLAVLSEAVERAGAVAATLPFRGWPDLAPVLARVRAGRPRVVGVSIQTSEAAIASLALCRLLREQGFGGTVVCGGHFATMNAADILAAPAHVDMVVRFAGEEALAALARGADRERWSELPGAIFRDVSGAVTRGAPPRFGPTLRRSREGALPEHLGLRAADLALSRGCEARCSYCCVGALSAAARREGISTGFERGAAGEIADEIADLWHGHGARVLNLMDDNLLPLDPGEARTWLEELAAALRRRRVGRIAFSLQLRADAVSEDVADALVEVGLVRAYVGIDGYSAPQLRALGRRAPAPAGALAVERLTSRGVYVVCNALLLGPTFTFESIVGEIEALATFRGAPVHLLPIEARPGTPYSERAERLGLVEGSFLHRHTRCADERVGILADLVSGLPTRLAERSVPIALYDLGYNLGVARRLTRAAGLERLDRLYAEVTEVWNADQIRYLRAAGAVAAGRDRALARSFLAAQTPAVRAHDERLLERCDSALREVERAVSAVEAREVRAHARGRLLAGVALSMSLAACGGSSSGVDASGTDAVATDAVATDAVGTDSVVYRPDGSATCTDQDPPIMQECSCEALRVHLDERGAVTSFEAANGATLDRPVVDCLNALFEGVCYPSLAGQTLEVAGHCWIA